jgi:hypothetical protein
MSKKNTGKMFLTGYLLLFTDNKKKILNFEHSLNKNRNPQ